MMSFFRRRRKPLIHAAILTHKESVMPDGNGGVLHATVSKIAPTSVTISKIAPARRVCSFAYLDGKKSVVACTAEPTWLEVSLINGSSGPFEIELPWCDDHKDRNPGLVSLVELKSESGAEPA